MSTETHVFFRGKLPTKAALSRAIKELGFPFAIKPATGSLEQQSGFMPMRLRREETGVEFDVYDDRSAVEEFSAQGVDPSFERRASLRWGGDIEEAVAGMCVAAALVKLVNGVVFDEAENRLLSIEDAIEVARKNLKELPAPPKQRLPRELSALKRVLAPLLAKRSDLALVDHLLLIHPARHLIRGAIFRWHYRGMVCSAAPYIRPLYQPSELFLADAVFSTGVDNPDFAPMLFDRLATEVFEPLGKIATIEDLIASSWGKRLRPIDLYPSILLSRGIAKAKAYMAPFEAAGKKFLVEAKARLAVTDRSDAFAMSIRKAEAKAAEEGIVDTKARQAFLARKDAVVFAHYRDREAKVARGFKIEQIWERSPFPAELPAAQRKTRHADPTFTPTPWLEFPTTWHQDPPGVPGEVRFGRHWWHRQGRVTLLHPITREQAKACHNNLEHYVLATRLPEGQLLMLTRGGSKEGRFPPLVYYDLWIYDAPGRRMKVDFREDHDDPGVLKLQSVDIEGANDWHSFLNFRRSEKSIHDSRMKEHPYSCRPITDKDRSAYTFALPRFGEFDLLWQKICMYLDAEDFGAFK